MSDTKTTEVPVSSLSEEVTDPVSPTTATCKKQILKEITPDTLIQLLGYLDCFTLGIIQRTSTTLCHYADLDSVWRPLVLKFLTNKLVLLKGLREKVTSTQREPLSQGICRGALRAAIVDSTRCLITKQEICSLRFNMRIRNFRELSAMNDRVPEGIAPIFVRFSEDWSVRTEGEELGSEHPMFNWNSRWEFVPAMASLIPVNGGESFKMPPITPPKSEEEAQRIASMGQKQQLNHLLNREKEFTCFHWYGRPPLKVSRHPTNWSVCMTHMNTQYSSSRLPPLGSDDFLDNMPPYLHPAIFSNQLFGGQGGDDDDDDDDEGLLGDDLDSNDAPDDEDFPDE